MSDRYPAPPRTANNQGFQPQFGVVPSRGALLSFGLLPNLGLFGLALFAWRVTDGLGTGNLTRATSATFNEDT
jgi:hypothetical protein